MPPIDLPPQAVAQLELECVVPDPQATAELPAEVAAAFTYQCPECGTGSRTGECVPTTHFVMLAQGILYRRAGLDVVWRQFVVLFAIGAALFA